MTGAAFCCPILTVASICLADCYFLGRVLTGGTSAVDVDLDAEQDWEFYCEGEVESGKVSVAVEDDAFLYLRRAVAAI